MDWRPGVGWSVGDGTGEVATFVNSGAGYGCGYPAASGRLLDGDESGRPRSVCSLSLQGTASKMLKLGLNSCGFPLAEVAAGALESRVPPRFRAYGGNGSVASLIGSGHDASRRLFVVWSAVYWTKLQLIM